MQHHLPMPRATAIADMVGSLQITHPTIRQDIILARRSTHLPSTGMILNLGLHL